MELIAKIKRKHLVLIIAPVLCLILVFFILDNLIWPLPANRLYRDNAHFIYDRNGQLLNCFASTDHFWRLPLTLDQISPNLINSVIASEDRWFYYHPGFNTLSLLEATVDNLKAGKVVRGGSTITMQIARMMEPKERTVRSKLIELFRAVQLEVHYSKNDLLNIYFNLVPYGGNIEGVGAAAYFYFGKSARQLSWSEAAILTAIPSSPNQYRPDLSPTGCRTRRDVILTSLKARGIIDEVQYTAAIAEEIPTRRYERPFIAPQFSQTMISQYPTTAAVKTSIDAKTQTMCERLAWGHYLSLADKNIHNLSVVVLDNQTGELLALVGSPDFEDTRHNGQINGAMAARSPGSALKPFVYALGLENGLITPLSRVDDIPISINGYSPDNYDELFRGIVTARAALVMSLNIPAVNMEQAVGLERFYDFLKIGGLTTLFRKYDEYGLPLVLGSCEVTLLELSNSYATLGRGGIYKPVRQLMTADSTQGRRILSEEASYIISDILSNLRRPELTTSWMDTKNHAVIAWKTGTSYGRKDAWAIGYNPQFTVGVWAGNFNGEGSPYLVGVEAAAPLMLNIFNEITKGKELTWFEKPDRVEWREVCTVSGMPPDEHCGGTVKDLYIRGVSPIEPCNVHKQIFVDHDRRHMLCRACMHGAAHIDTMIVEQWPARLSDWLIKQGLVQPLPTHNRYCMGPAYDDAPVIVSPEPEGYYELRASAPAEYQKILFKASVSLESGKVHWFLDNRLYATADAGENIFYPPERGVHKLMCVDALGRSSKVVFEVK